MTGMEYLTPDGQQLTLDVTACGGGGGFSATKTKVTQNCPKWINPKSKIFLTLRVGGGSSATKTKVRFKDA